MKKYRKKPIIVEAVRWFKSGDHPEDNRETFKVKDGEPFSTFVGAKSKEAFIKELEAAL